MRRSVLGVDLASGIWSDNGSALIEYDDAIATFLRVVPGAIEWQNQRKSLTPAALAEQIVESVRRHEVSAIALDGPQGWRSPATSPGTPGVGRRCEYDCNTQGKTGQYPTTYPGNQRPWIEFCIQVFDELLRSPGLVLAPPDIPAVVNEGCLVLECYPTSTWRSSGLRPLPGKRKKPPLEPFVQAIRSAYRLPTFVPSTHDDLQAVVAALAAVAVLHGPATAKRRGVPATTVLDSNGGPRRVEGFIWDACPLDAHGRAVPVSTPAEPPRLPPTAGDLLVYVTQGVLDQVNRTADVRQAQIAFTGMQGGTRENPRTVTLLVDGDKFALVVGDSNAMWPRHQNEETQGHFESLFALLADRPDERVPASIL